MLPLDLPLLLTPISNKYIIVGWVLTTVFLAQGAFPLWGEFGLILEPLRSLRGLKTLKCLNE